MTDSLFKRLEARITIPRHDWAICPLSVLVGIPHSELPYQYTSLDWTCVGSMSGGSKHPGYPQIWNGRPTLIHYILLDLFRRITPQTHHITRQRGWCSNYRCVNPFHFEGTPREAPRTLRGESKRIARYHDGPRTPSANVGEAESVSPSAALINEIEAHAWYCQAVDRIRLVEDLALKLFGLWSQAEIEAAIPLCDLPKRFR